MYEIGLREIKGRDVIVSVYNKGQYLFDAYKGIDRLTAEDKKYIKSMQPDTEFAKSEDIQ